MPYPMRQCFEGTVLHVVTRGDNRERIFVNDIDRRGFLHALQTYATDFRISILAYALMPNHIHLIARQNGTDTLSRFMHSLTIKYTKYFNKQYSRVGHVFQGRFRSRVIETDSYLLVASRYVHLNPVKAGLADHPLRYSWSSYKVYAEGTETHSLVDCDLILGLMGTDRAQQRLRYRDFVETPWPQQSRHPVEDHQLHEAWNAWLGGPTGLRVGI